MTRNFLLATMASSLVISLIVYVYLNSLNEESKQDELSDHEVYWTYEGEKNPNQWEPVDAAYEACERGEAQSPINIDVTNIEQQSSISEIQLQYHNATIAILNNGHTIQANVKPEGQSLTVGDKSFNLVEMHFHQPSEHQLNGKNYDMEAHLIHEDENGELAVIGLFIEEGQTNAELAPIWSILPKHHNEEILVEDSIQLQNLIPEDKSGFQYVGSLTTPPCTEGVGWFVLEKPIQMSKEQIQLFKNIFPNNHRPVQSLNDRKIYEMNLK